MRTKIRNFIKDTLNPFLICVVFLRTIIIAFIAGWNDILAILYFKIPVLYMIPMILVMSSIILILLHQQNWKIKRVRRRR